MSDAKAIVPKSTGAAILAAIQKAIKSGSAGFVAGTMQVVAFMWLRTAMNYQYKRGGTLMEVLKKLYAEGGIGRFYQGLFPWAIVQAPLSRFGDVAANEMVVSVFQIVAPQIPVGISTFAASMSGASWRIFITPVDTCKTILQTDGDKGWALLKEKVGKNGLFTLWDGWAANYVANVVGNYPWFATMNVMSKNVPVPAGAFMKIVRNAFNGACASAVSDCVSNSIRVVKTKKQTHENANIGYVAAAKEIVDSSGFYGLFFRGLETRIYTNILQTAFFTILWKALAGSR